MDNFLHNWLIPPFPMDRSYLDRSRVPHALKKYSPINVSLNELTFYRNKSSSRTIKIGRENHEQIRIKHNLPSCFKLDPSDEFITAPCTILVSYDPSARSPMEKFPNQMNIGIGAAKRNRVEVKFEEEDKTSDALLCQVCLRQFSETDENLLPRVLTSCGHTLCQECVGKFQVPIVEEEGQDEDEYESEVEEVMACPFDRIQTELPVTDLPLNRPIIEMLREIEEAKRLEESKFCQNPDVPCEENPKHEATCYCTTCKVDLCDSCFHKSHSSKIFFHHNAIPIAKRPVALPNCQVHPDECVYFECKTPNCRQPNRLFCEACRLTQHKNHNYTNLLDTIDENQETLKKIAESLESNEEKCKKELEKMRNLAKKMEKSSPEYDKNVKEIVEFFERKKKEILKMLEQHVNEKRKKLDRHSDKIENEIDKMDKTKKQILRMLKQKKGLHDVEDLIDKGRSLSSFEADNGECRDCGYPPIASVIHNVPDSQIHVRPSKNEARMIWRSWKEELRTSSIS